MNTIDSLVALNRRLLLALVIHNRALETFADRWRSSVILTIRAHAADTPRVIGQKGAHLKAMAEILRTAGAREGINYVVGGVQEPIVGDKERLPKFKFNPDWPRAEIQQLLTDTAVAAFGGAVVEFNGVMANRFTIQTAEENEAVIRALHPHFQALFKSICMTAGAAVTIVFL